MTRMNGSISRATPSQVGVLSQRERGILRLNRLPLEADFELTNPRYPIKQWDFGTVASICGHVGRRIDNSTAGHIPRTTAPVIRQFDGRPALHLPISVGAVWCLLRRIFAAGKPCCLAALGGGEGNSHALCG